MLVHNKNITVPKEKKFLVIFQICSLPQIFHAMWN